MKKQSTRNAKITVIVLSPLLFILLFCSVFQYYQKLKYLDESSILSYAKIIRTVNHNLYELDIVGSNNTHRFILSPSSYTELGDVYVTKYAVRDSSKLMIYHSKPIFLDFEKTDFTMGKIAKHIFSIIGYSYSVNGITYYRENLLSEDKNNKIPEIGDSLKVEYLKERPLRSIIYPP